MSGRHYQTADGQVHANTNHRRDARACRYHALPCHVAPSIVGRTLRISCEAVPPSVWPAGAQGGTSARHSGAALSLVSCIRLFGGPYGFPKRRP
jgi:hypothetical protein